ncbi:DUF2726 domain-containing protein [Escherichia coli]
MDALTVLVIILVFVLIYLLRLIFRQSDLTDEGDKKQVIANKQLNAVINSDFSRTSLMNASETTLYKAFCDHINDKAFPVRIFPQVSLGEILKSKDRTAFFSVNSKRVDFVVTDLNYIPVAVIEYQGSGHYKGNAKVRDEIKKIACEKAGIKYLPVQEKYTLRDIDAMLLAAVGC